MAERGKRLLRQLYVHRQLYLFLILPVAYLIIFHYIPMSGVQIAFRKFSIRKGIWNSPWVGLDYFERFFSTYMFGRVLKNTLLLSAYSIFAGFPIPILFALGLNVMRNEKYKKTVQLVTYAPHFVPVIVLCSMILLYTNEANGLVNNLIAALGGTRHDFMTDVDWFRSIYVWTGVWQNLGWGTIIYLATLSNVSPDWIEAARIDGANRFQIVWHIQIPFLLPTAIVLLILNTGSMLTVGFEKVYLLQNSLNLPVSQVISTYVYQVGLQDAKFS